MRFKIVLLSLLMMVMITGVFPASAFATVEATNATENNTENISVPTGVTARMTSYQSIKVSWKAVDNAGGYKIYMSTKPNSGFVLKGIVSKNTTSFSLRGLTTGMRHYFEVKTVINANVATTSSVNVSENSKVVSAVPMMFATQIRTFLNTSTKMTIKWHRVSGASGYVIYRKKGHGKYVRVKHVTNGRIISYKQARLSKQTIYTYLIRPYRTIKSKKVYGPKKTRRQYMPKVLSTSSTGYSGKYTYASKIIKKARTKLGTRYVWGASGPNKFDCSGFTYWVIKHSGVKKVAFARRSAQGIYNAFKKYSIGRSLSKAQPGDLILFGHSSSTRRIYHVGIYYGGGKYIHATTGGRGVTISKVPTGQLASIIRRPGLR